MRTSENSGFQSDSDIDEDCPNQNIYITSESSDDSDFLYDDSSEESLDECFEEMGAIGKDSNSKYSETAILTSFILKHNLSKNASKDLTKLVKCLSKNKKTPTLSDILAFSGIAIYNIFHYCGKCGYVFSPINSNEFQCKTVNCNGLRYKGSLNKQGEAKYPRNKFLIADIKTSLKDLLEKKEIWNVIAYRKKIAKKRNHHENKADIIFAKEYQKLSKEGQFLWHEFNISAQFNTDGVEIFQSSSVKIWPIYIAINELNITPVNIRCARDNMILVGVWQGKGQPPHYQYIHKFSEDMSKLFHDGFPVKINDKIEIVRICVILGSMDLPAKAKVLNMTQFNGSFGCSTCEIEGLRVKKGRGTVQVYPHKPVGEKANLRSNEEINMVIAPRATLSKRIKGIIGYSGLMIMPLFDLVIGVVPDYMHGSLLGATKLLPQLWFSSTNSKKSHFISNRKNKQTNG